MATLHHHGNHTSLLLGIRSGGSKIRSMQDTPTEPGMERGQESKLYQVMDCYMYMYPTSIIVYIVTCTCTLPLLLCTLLHVHVPYLYYCVHCYMYMYPTSIIVYIVTCTYTPPLLSLTNLIIHVHVIYKDNLIYLMYIMKSLAQHKLGHYIKEN